VAAAAEAEAEKKLSVDEPPADEAAPNAEAAPVVAKTA
jgi:hypothetical protein